MAIDVKKHLPTREEIPAEFKWKLTDIYKTNEEWEADFLKLKEYLKLMAQKQPGFLVSSSNMLEVLRFKDKIGMLLDKLYVYAHMHKDENTADPFYQALSERIQTLSTDAESVLSFIVPALVNFSWEKLADFIDANPGLRIYQHFFAEISRQKEHILSVNEEKILAASTELAEASGTIFGMLDNADIKFPSIIDENGEEFELTKGRYSKFLESADRRVRYDAFTALYNTYAKFRNTLGSTLNASVKSDIFYAKIRHFNSALEASLDNDNIPVIVYDRLIETVHEFIPALNRYLRLRKKIMNLPDLHMYDLYASLIPEYRTNIDYHQARELVINGLEPLGEDYINKVKLAFENGWIDVYETENKRSGAYAWGAYETHPYILLNFQGKIHDAFTVAHEMGHALHSFYSNENQPYIYSGYKIFVAEVASTVNEALLMEYLLKKSNEIKEKMYLINQYLEQFRTTVFRQTMFAEFEKIIHEEVENGGALTAEWLSRKYLELNQVYYGAETVIDPEIAMEWSRIPHFYSAFYVYKYATGYSAAIALSQAILNNKAGARDRYLEFLKSGGSDYPLVLLEKAGINMESPEPIREALKVFQRLVDELIELTGVSI